MKLSVCIVTFNHEQFIRQCVESVLAQDAPFDFEIVIGEDKSPDGTLAILEELATQHPKKLRVMPRPHNLGAEKNFNQTISECRGEYIAFLEGDNFWSATDKLRKQAEFLDLHPEASFCFHRASYVDSAGEHIDRTVPEEDPPHISKFDYLLKDYNPVPFGTMLVRGLLLDGIENWVEGLKIGDWPICMMLADGLDIGFIPATMSVQRVHEGGTWQLLPDTVKLVHIIRALEHIQPQLSPERRALLSKRIEYFEARLKRQLEHDAESCVQVDPQANDASAASGSARVNKVKGMTEEFNSSVRDAIQSRKKYKKSKRELAFVRRDPWKVLSDLWQNRVLTYLSGNMSLFSSRRLERFRQSAAKRNPSRSLATLGEPITAASEITRSGFSYQEGKPERDTARGNVIVVCHEASRSGAPILGLNIAKSLARHYNVTTICLSGGTLVEAFRQTSTDIYLANGFYHEGERYCNAILELCRQRSYSFAIVNSLESRGSLKGLRAAKVPMVTLIHEFSSCTKPKSAIVKIFKLSTEVVFSTKFTLENALFENGLLPIPNLHVLPQGKCLVLPDGKANAPSGSEAAHLRQVLRPDSGRRFVVVGVGSVQIRKGVDLFIEIATRVLTEPGGEHVSFAWVGDGYDPDKDMGYSVYLHDQFYRAGLADRVKIIGATPDIETVYELSDAFLLSSRLDPLPNVAIVSLCLGKPVFTFDRTGGIAEILTRYDLGNACVATYLDTSEMAAKILALATSPDEYARVASRCRTMADEMFDFDAYVERLRDIASTAEAKVHRTGSSATPTKTADEVSGSGT